MMMDKKGPYDESLLVQRAITAVEAGEELPLDVREDISSLVYDGGRVYAVKAVTRLSKQVSPDNVLDEGGIDEIIDSYIATLVKPTESYEDFRKRERVLLPFLRELQKAMTEGQISDYPQ